MKNITQVGVALIVALALTSCSDMDNSETLASKAELLRSEDLGDYLRVRIDGRDLNYNKYLNEGDMKIIETEDYNSQNTLRMKVSEIEKMLLSQPEIISKLEKRR